MLEKARSHYVLGSRRTFSERLIDDVEKQHERIFKYSLRNIRYAKMLAPKNRNWAEKSSFAVLRADFAQIQNDVLEFWNKIVFTSALIIARLKHRKQRLKKMVTLFLLASLAVSLKNMSGLSRTMKTTSRNGTLKNMTTRQRELRSRMFTAVAEVKKWERVIISYHDA